MLGVRYYVLGGAKARITVGKSHLSWNVGKILSGSLKFKEKRVKPNYYNVGEMLSWIDEPNSSGCLKLLEENRRLFQTVQGSTNNHQNWTGGYFDHVQEIMNLAVLLYGTLTEARELPFSLSDLLLSVYLHDVEKPWKYELGEDGQLHHIASMQTKEAQQQFRMKKLAEYGIVCTTEQENAIRYAEGELDDYTNRRRVMGPLACVTHMCDVASARLWFGHPAEANDPWSGASRVRN